VRRLRIAHDRVVRTEARNLLAIFLTAFVAAGCATAIKQVPGGPHERLGLSVPAQAQPTSGEKVVSIASEYLGTPYLYGGDSPKKGFDCSGLVYFSFDQMGVKVPRTAADQRKAAEKVSPDDLEPGDLLFFRSSKGRVDHVGIYAGDGRFIHAPNAGSVVSYAYLDAPYYRSHFVGAGRF
jgi:cell wall-associated NlpC family hydrolase